MPLLASFACGLIFGLGLLISGMLQPAKVLAFLDIFGAWDPSLAIVMGVALLVAYAGFAVARGRAPACACPAERVALLDRYRRKAGRRVGAVWRGLGPRWLVPGACP